MAAKRPEATEHELKISKQQSEKILALQHQVDQAQGLVAEAKGQVNNYITAIIDGQDISGRWDVTAFDPVKLTIGIKKGGTDGPKPVP